MWNGYDAIVLSQVFAAYLKLVTYVEMLLLTSFGF